MGRERAQTAHANRQSPWRPRVCERDDPDRHRPAAAARRRRRYDGQADPASDHTTDRVETGNADPQPEVQAGARRVVIQHLLQRMAGDKPDVIIVEGLVKIIKGNDRIARLLIGLRRKRIGRNIEKPILINGDLGIVSYVNDRPVAVFWFEIGERNITRVYRLINPDKLKGVPSLDDRARDGRVPVADAITLVC